MFSIQEYIKQNVKNPVYSITKWASATNTVGTTWVATVDETKNTPVLIFINALYMNFTTAVPGGITLRDTVGNILISIPASPGIGTLNPFAMFHLFKAKIVTLQGDGALNGFSFCYQYIKEG